MVIRTTNRVGLGEGDRMAIDNELIDKLLKDYKKPEDLVGENGLLKELTKRLLERAMSAEMTEHVGYESTTRQGITRATRGMGRRPRRSKEPLARCRSKFHGIEMGRSSLRSSKSIRRGSRVSTTTSFRSMPGDYRRGRSSRTWKKSTT